jgi:hypothetical protein
VLQQQQQRLPPNAVKLAAMASLVVNGIDIEAVKEQLLLLGHSVDDRTIVDFVAGLDLGATDTSTGERSAVENSPCIK